MEFPWILVDDNSRRVTIHNSTDLAFVCEPGNTVFDPGKIVQQSFVSHVEYHETLDSTNKLAKELLPDLLPVCPALVLTARQTAGRGRGSNVWLATEGALTFSVIVDTSCLQIPTNRLPLVSLAAGLAVRNAMQHLATTHSVSIKWPNDVLLNEQKICGILTEQHQISEGTACIIGIGVNINNSLRSSDQQFKVAATSLYDATGQTTDLSTTLVAILEELNHQLNQLSEAPSDFFSELNNHSVLNDRTIKIDAGNQVHQGVCRGIDDDGYLMLQVGSELTSIVAGSVVEWR